jgi:hypothetical protein
MAIDRSDPLCVMVAVAGNDPKFCVAAELEAERVKAP